jgi:peptidoglycan/LPS O-acetylase OafA/YrhL
MPTSGGVVALRGRVSWEILALTRFFLAWIVLSSHLIRIDPPGTWPYVWNAFGGKAAVVGFLFISGFSIGASYEREPQAFYARRFLRIYPLYFAAVFFAWVLEMRTGGHVVLPNDGIDSIGTLRDAANLLFLQTFAVKPIQFDGPVWSLSLEVLYYVLTPVFARLSRPRLLGLIALSFVASMLPKHSDWGTAYWLISKFNALNYLWCWLLGFMLWRRMDTLTIGICIAASLVDATQQPESLAAVTILIALCAIVASREVTLTGLTQRVADYLGNLSYPLYVFHFPAVIFGWWALHLRSTILLTLTAFAISAAALYTVDERLNDRYLKPWLLQKVKRRTVAAQTLRLAPTSANEAAQGAPPP